MGREDDRRPSDNSSLAYAIDYSLRTLHVDFGGHLNEKENRGSLLKEMKNRVVMKHEISLSCTYVPLDILLLPRLRYFNFHYFYWHHNCANQCTWVKADLTHMFDDSGHAVYYYRHYDKL